MTKLETPQRDTLANATWGDAEPNVAATLALFVTLVDKRPIDALRYITSLPRAEAMRLLDGVAAVGAACEVFGVALIASKKASPLPQMPPQ